MLTLPLAGIFGQTFQLSDLAGVAALVVLEALLSADNALVLAIMVKHLPKDQRQRALLYGLAGAFVFRLIAILLAKYVLSFWWLQAVGAAYLLYLPIRHFVTSSKDQEVKPIGAGFWQTVVAVEMTDIAFAIDSVLAGVTFIDNKSEKIWVVYFGAIIGIILLRIAAGFFVRVMERYPMLDHVAYLLVAWVGVKLAFLSGHSFERGHPDAMSFSIPEMPTAVFWGVLLAIGITGTWFALSRGRDPVDEEAAREVESAQDLSISDEERQRP